MAGKGDKYRRVDAKKYGDSHDRIFKKKCCLEGEEIIILKLLKDRGCDRHKPEVILENGDKVVVRCGQCRMAMTQGVYKILIDHWKEK